MNFKDLNALDLIKTAAAIVSEDDLTKLRLEEEMLVILIRKPGVNLGIKKKILDRINEINRKQLEILGGSWS